MMAELIAYHRKVCRRKVGNQGVPHWLASYEGRNNVREQRWCAPAPATWKIIAFRDRLVRKRHLGDATRQAADAFSAQ